MATKISRGRDSHSVKDNDLRDERTKRCENNDSSSSLEPEEANSRNAEHEPIIWHYLEFNTELPQPGFQKHGQLTRDRGPPPECPNLNAYTSPFLWSPRRKSVMTWLSVVATALTAYNAGAYTLGIDQMMDLWGISQVAAYTGVTVFTCGFGIAPMILAPFSELAGRRPVFVVTGLLFVLFQIVCGITPTFAGMLINRFLAGCASSTFSTMVGGVVSDIYHAEDRNTAMALFTGGAMTGTGLGPLVSGFIAQHTTWRWIFYLQVILDGVLMIFIFFFFKETRGSVLLSRKAKTLNEWYVALEAEGYYGVMMPPCSSQEKPHEQATIQRIRWKVKADEERSSLATMIRISLHRPLHMLITEPVVFFFSLWISFAWAVLYLTFSAVPLIFQTTYGFNLEQTGAVFASIAMASILFTFVTVYQEKLGRKYLPERQRKILETPEGRLYFACVESVLLPLGCVWFGVSGAYSSVPWIVPTLGIACATMGVFCTYLAVFNYLADSYHRYASSALAAQSFCRNILCGAFPLFTRQMFTAMTFQGAGGFLGGLGLLLTAVPWVLLLYGPAIRAKSKLASEGMRNNTP